MRERERFSAITFKEWIDIHPHYRTVIDGQSYVLVNSLQGSVLVPVEIEIPENGEGHEEIVSLPSE